MQNFDPTSPNAMFATILRRLDDQDRRAEERRLELKELIEELRTTDRKLGSDIHSLKHFRTTLKAKVAVIVTVVTCLASGGLWILERFFLK